MENKIEYLVSYQVKPSLNKGQLCYKVVKSRENWARNDLISVKFTIAVSVDVNSDVHSHFMAQIEGEFSPLNYGVTMFPVRLRNQYTETFGICQLQCINNIFYQYNIRF